MAIISAIAAVFAFYGPRLTTTNLAGLRKPGIGGSFVYGLVFSLGTSAAPLLLLLSVAAATANPVYGYILALSFGIGRGLPFLIVSAFAVLLQSLHNLHGLEEVFKLLVVLHYYLFVITM